ncbi:MAG: hypothetical protein ACRYGF_07405 [Janthinobacterium lividum]
MQSQPWDYASASPSRFALRPLTTGETLDRSFALFRASFPLCVGIGIVPALLTVVQFAVRSIYLKAAHLSPLTPMWSSPGLGLILSVFSVLSFFAYGWSSASICWAASRRYLGRSVTIRESFGVVLRHWFRYPALLVLQALQAAWLPILLATAGTFLIPFGGAAGGGTLRAVGGLLMALAGLTIFVAMYLYIRLSVAMPAAVVEDLSPGAALGRSKDLLQTRKGRVFAVLLLIGIFYVVISSFIGFLGLSFLRGHVALIALQAVGLLVTMLSSLLLQPLLMVALCVVYYDERVRREGYDLVALMEESVPAVPTYDAMGLPSDPATL